MGNVEEHFIDLLYDPQTSGGLLVSVRPEDVEQMLLDFDSKGMDTKVSVIGKVRERGEKLICLRQENRNG